ncbi:hypothetical protein GMOD_00009849 [Pyrenophora seminiperda CCB06]|uniref:Uncharacterized protein n=1 Tax=Pyrenophora seminiperda CCB06 TaxID=1302712 RepID=A0A3M7MED7_9PLEO|nr:hypothetical protein GMOD_00009849 [Pyrenophora seminiperda CCB06]
MADAPSSHSSPSTASAENPHADAGHGAQESAVPFVQPPATSANLSLRQARNSGGGGGDVLPKIHDVTAKFTRACNGKSSVNPGFGGAMAGQWAARS